MRCGRRGTENLDGQRSGQVYEYRHASYKGTDQIIYEVYLLRGHQLHDSHQRRKSTWL